MTSMQLNSTMLKMSIEASNTAPGKKKQGTPASATASAQLSAATTHSASTHEHSKYSSPQINDTDKSRAPLAASMWMSADPTAAAAAVWANRTKPLFSNRLMDALREKGAVTSFVDVVDNTAAKEKEPEPEPEPQCSLEEEMQSLRDRLKEARDEIRASTVEALGCKNDLRDVRRKGHKRLTRKSSLETLNNNGGRWTNRPAAVSNFAPRHASTSSTGSDSLDDEYGYGDDDSQSDAELQAELERCNSNGGDRRGSGSVLMLSGSQDSWALSGKSIAGRRRRRHMVENGGGGGGGGGRNVGGYLHLRNMSSNNTDESDAAGEYIFDGSNTTGGGSSGDRESRLGLMRVSLKSVGVGGGSAADLFAKSTRNSPMSRMAGHGAMPSSPKHRRRKKKGGKGGGGGSSSAGNSPKGSPKQRRKQKRTNADGSPRKRGGKKGVGVKTSRSVPSSTLAHTSFSTSAPKLPSASSHVKSYSAPSSPRVSRRGATQAPSPSQIADAVAAKKQFQKPSNLMMQSPSHSRNGSLLSLAPKLSALMQTGLRQSSTASTAAFSG